jgi:hypothetical protein
LTSWVLLTADIKWPTVSGDPAVVRALTASILRDVKTQALYVMHNATCHA